MKILITGAAGFIGKNLWQELEAHGHDVEGVDLDPGQLVGFPQFRGCCHQSDLTDQGNVERLLDVTRPSVVIHLAAQVGRLFGERDWAHTINSNTVMTAQLAGCASAVGARLVYASTSEVYGDRGEQVCSEDGEMELPHNLYGLSKRWGEEACRLYAPRELTILRFSMPYGIGVPPGRGRAAINNVLWQAVTGQDIPIHIGAERSWCWVGDTVRGVRLILESGQSGAWNVGRDDARVTMLRLADIAVDLAGASRAQIRMVPAPSRQTVVKRLATHKLRALGWSPQVELEEGMTRVLDWVRQFSAEGVKSER